MGRAHARLPTAWGMHMLGFRLHGARGSQKHVAVATVLSQEGAARSSATSLLCPEVCALPCVEARGMPGSFVHSIKVGAACGQCPAKPLFKRLACILPRTTKEGWTSCCNWTDVLNCGVRACVCVHVCRPRGGPCVRHKAGRVHQ